MKDWTLFLIGFNADIRNIIWFANSVNLWSSFWVHYSTISSITPFFNHSFHHFPYLLLPFFSLCFMTGTAFHWLERDFCSPEVKSTDAFIPCFYFVFSNSCSNPYSSPLYNSGCYMGGLHKLTDFSIAIDQCPSLPGVCQEWRAFG